QMMNRGRRFPERFLQGCCEDILIRNCVLSDSSYSLLPPFSVFASLALSLGTEAGGATTFESGVSCCRFLEFIEVRMRAILRLTVFISPSSFFSVPRAAADRNLESSVRSSFNRFVRSSSDNALSSVVLSCFISFTLLLFAR